MPEPLSWGANAAHAPLARPGRGAPLLEPTGFAATDRDIELPKSDEGIQRDLEALFAIRDAAMAQAATKPARPASPPGFEPTQPAEDSEPPNRH